MIENEKRKFKFNTDTTSLVLLTATLLWMALIFYMSSQTGEASSFLSSSLSEGLAKLANSIFRGSAPPKLLEPIRNELILRKSGHVFEYLVLGILVYSWVRRQGFRVSREALGTQVPRESRGIQKAQGPQGTQGTQVPRESWGTQVSQEARGTQGTQKAQGTQGTQKTRETNVEQVAKVPQEGQVSRKAQESQEVQVSQVAQVSKASRVSKISTRTVPLSIAARY